MKIIAKSGGVSSEHEVDASGVSALVHEPGIKVTVPNAYTITPEDTIRCMREMSQPAWAHISGGELFRMLFDKLFSKSVSIPETITVLLEDYDDGVIHAAGLIVLLVEARFAGRQQVFLKLPETYLHPKVTYMLMSVILDIQKIPNGGLSMEVRQS